MKLSLDMVRRRFYSQMEERTLCENLSPKCVKCFKFINWTRPVTTLRHTALLKDLIQSTLCQSLPMYVAKDQKDWEEYIPLILFAHRTSIYEATGDSPFYLLHGREPRLQARTEKCQSLLPAKSRLYRRPPLKMLINSSNSCKVILN